MSPTPTPWAWGSPPLRPSTHPVVEGPGWMGPQPCLPAEVAERGPEHPPEGPVHSPHSTGAHQEGQVALGVYSLLLALGTAATATAEGLGHLALTPTPFRRSVRFLPARVRSCWKQGTHRGCRPPLLTWCRVLTMATPTDQAGPMLGKSRLGQRYDRTRTSLSSVSINVSPGPPRPSRRLYPLPELAAHLALDRTPLLPLTFFRLCK